MNRRNKSQILMMENFNSNLKKKKVRVCNGNKLFSTKTTWIEQTIDGHRRLFGKVRRITRRARHPYFDLYFQIQINLLRRSQRMRFGNGVKAGRRAKPNEWT